ncbi:MAG: hypothetical protein EHM36_02775 [Deltaproteobacteria bacterium]|nr:MAG: hypothetical protein EHM36_02775 [Deltaproteobacteria bacterium]
MRGNFLKMILLSLCFLLGEMIFVPVGTSAWGPATHAFIAKGLDLKDPEKQEIYGSVAPDLFNFLERSPYDAYLAEQTHDRFMSLLKEARRNQLEAFSLGFISHNERWGADFTAHRNGMTTERGYVVTKSYKLVPQLRPSLDILLENAGVPVASWWASQLAPELSHYLVETAVDLLIKRNEDPAIGLDLFSSASQRPPSVPDLLVSAYAQRFALDKELSFDEARQIIRDAEEAFRQGMILYGQILDQDEPEAIKVLTEQGVDLLNTLIQSVTGKELNMPPSLLREFLDLAVQEVEGDYSQEIFETLAYLKRAKTMEFFIRILREN